MPMRKISVLSLFDFRKSEEEEGGRKLVKQQGGSAEFGFLDR